jgi:hypothetical protein
VNFFHHGNSLEKVSLRSEVNDFGIDAYGAWRQGKGNKHGEASQNDGVRLCWVNANVDVDVHFAHFHQRNEPRFK